MPTTFIKLDRSLSTWRWFQDRNTLQLWIYILMNANIIDHGFEKITVHRGDFVTSYESLSKATGMSVKEVRTALSHLVETGEVAIRKYPKFSVISVLNYNLYQGDGQASGSQWAGYGQASGRPKAIDRQAEDKRRAEQRQQYNNVIMKEINNERMKECEEEKHPHGRFNNVFITDSEYALFCSEYPLTSEEIINELSAKILTDENKYKHGHIGHLYVFAKHYSEPKQEEKKPSFDIELAMRRSLNIDPTKTKRGQL